MSQLQEVKDKIFFECQDLLRKISAVSNAEELVEQQDVLYRISENIAVLKVVMNGTVPIAKEAQKNADNDEFNQFSTAVELSSLNDTFDDEENLHAQSDSGELLPMSESEFKPEPNFESDDKPSVNNEDANNDIPVITDEGLEEELISEALLSEEVYERNVEALDRQTETETESPTETDSLRTIKEIEPHHPTQSTKEEEEKAEERRQNEKKIKLASIKALNKNLHSLFDDDPLETPPAQPERSLHNANMPTEYMEAPKRKPDFKLDLNDRIAFTQKLFGGSQTELNNAIQQLNTYSSLEDAKVYLSDLYYEKNWKKVDDYAQRLWMLVENKFL